MTHIIEKTDLAIGGQNGWECYRIPGIVVTSKGTILAYYETRTSPGDWDTENIAMRRSSDNGESWEPQRLLVENPEKDTVNNPVMIACRNGDIHFLWQKNYRRVFHQISYDDGNSWTEAQDITVFMDGFRKYYDWTVMALGPGHGIELSDGDLLIAVWLSNGGGEAHSPSEVATILSPDGGKTWKCGQIIKHSEDIVNPNESSVAQMADGRIMINMRQCSDARQRAVAVSPDGINSWSEPRLEPMLPDPICFGSLLSLPESEIMLFINCDTKGISPNGVNTRPRINLTLKASRDKGAAWPEAWLIENKSGYADLAASPDGKWVYCFYEREWVQGKQFHPEALTFARIDAEKIGLR